MIDYVYILMSIHPEHIAKIFSGAKKYEYRKIQTKRIPRKIIMYATHPISMVVGEAEVEAVLIDSPHIIWAKTQDDSGTTPESFFKYFLNSDQAIAYKLKNIIEYDQPKPLSAYGIQQAPQSFIYL